MIDIEFVIHLFVTYGKYDECLANLIIMFVD